MFRSPSQVELVLRKLPQKNGERQINDCDGTATKKDSPHTATISIVLLRKLREALPKSPQSVVDIDDSSKQQKITVKMCVSRETSAKST